MTQFEREVLRLLAYAHRQLDMRGVPRVHRPVEVPK